jgi:hypothetical protein
MAKMRAEAERKRKEEERKRKEAEEERKRREEAERRREAAEEQRQTESEHGSGEPSSSIYTTANDSNSYSPSDDNGASSGTSTTPSSTSSGSESSDSGDSSGTWAATGGTAVAGAGALAASGTGGGAEEEPGLSHDEAASRVIAPHNFGHYALMGATFGLIPIAVLLPAAINFGSVPRHESEAITDVVPLRSWLGPEGLRSWRGPVFSFAADVGVSHTAYRGLYYPDVTADESPGQGASGVLIDGPMTGISTHLRLRFRVLRLSFGYAHFLPRLLGNTFEDGVTSKDDIPDEPALSNPLGVYTAYTGQQSLVALDGSWGLQFFQGLLSPYAVHRVRWLMHTHPSGQMTFLTTESYSEANTDDYFGRAWEMPVGHELLIGNTIDLSGAKINTDTRKAKLTIDARLTVPIAGVLDPGFEISLGYNVSVL